MCKSVVQQNTQKQCCGSKIKTLGFFNIILIRYLHLPAPLWSLGLFSKCFYTAGDIWH